MATKRKMIDIDHRNLLAELKFKTLRYNCRTYRKIGKKIEELNELFCDADEEQEQNK